MSYRRTIRKEIIAPLHFTINEKVAFNDKGSTQVCDLYLPVVVYLSFLHNTYSGESGGTGRRAGFRTQWFLTVGVRVPLSHQNSTRTGVDFTSGSNERALVMGRST